MGGEEFISEPIRPKRGTGNAAAMSRGEPGLPSAFTWRGREYRIAGVVKAWKSSSREGGSPRGELYLRRHWWTVRCESGEELTVYCERQARGGRANRRWFLFTMRRPAAGA
jgi:hypothetical protein